MPSYRSQAFPSNRRTTWVFLDAPLPKLNPVAGCTAMLQLTLEQPKSLKLAEVPDPRRQAGQALVKVRRVGICGTDLHAYRGQQPFFTYPRVLGHELAVEVMETDAGVDAVRPGDHCVVFPYLDCGRCIACRRGKTNCCVHMRVLGVHEDGGMCEYLSLPVDRLIPAEELTLEQMALVENQCIGAHAVRRADLDARDTVLVVGAGPIGLGVIQFARAAGARVLVADLAPAKLEFCRAQLGVDEGLPVDADFPQRLRDLTAGDLPSVVFDATGHPGSMEAGFELVAHGGTYVLVSLVQSDIRFWDPEFHKRELTLLSSRNATRQDFEQVMAAMRSEAIVTDPLITHPAPFTEVVQRFESWLDPAQGVIKAMAHL